MSNLDNDFVQRIEVSFNGGGFDIFYARSDMSNPSATQKWLGPVYREGETVASNIVLSNVTVISFQDIKKEIPMTNNKYPLTVQEARAALVNEPVGTIVESEDYKDGGNFFAGQWRFCNLNLLLLEQRRWSRQQDKFHDWFPTSTYNNRYLPVEPKGYRIIALDSPAHPDYVSPQPTVKMLTADEALALEEFCVVAKIFSHPEITMANNLSVMNEGYTLRRKYCQLNHLPPSFNVVDSIVAHLAMVNKWPIVATEAEALQLIKEGK
jgi:hypothetical protein